ncbi:MAG: PilZ domain-containing protein [Gammaproteobacteria bacterium]|nr:PilZ domain-containing protein [Gammaproteobacteria bacterium]
MDSTLQCKPASNLELYRAYMPFVAGGGIFIPTDQIFELNQEVKVELSIPEGENFTFTGNVIWISPKKMLVESTRTGVGIKLEDEQANKIRAAIEAAINEFLKGDQPTDTL